MSEGWIKISRELKKHWVYQRPEMFKVWISLLITANFKDGKMVLGNKVYTIKRGQTSMSLRSWAHEFDMSVKAVTNVFNMLEKEGMIKREKLGKGKHSTTLITIENYDNYQGVAETLEKRNGNLRETLGEHEGGTIEECKEREERKEGEEESARPTLDEFIKWGLKKRPEVSKEALRLKYEAWKDNNWQKTVSGKNAPIKNWKSTLTNTVIHLPAEPKKDDPRGSEWNNVVF